MCRVQTNLHNKKKISKLSRHFLTDEFLKLQFPWSFFSSRTDFGFKKITVIVQEEEEEEKGEETKHWGGFFIFFSCCRCCFLGCFAFLDQDNCGQGFIEGGDLKVDHDKHMQSHLLGQNILLRAGRIFFFRKKLNSTFRLFLFVLFLAPNISQFFA